MRHLHQAVQRPQPDGLSRSVLTKTQQGVDSRASRHPSWPETDRLDQRFRRASRDRPSRDCHSSDRGRLFRSSKRKRPSSPSHGPAQRLNPIARIARRETSREAASASVSWLEPSHIHSVPAPKLPAYGRFASSNYRERTISHCRRKVAAPRPVTVRQPMPRPNQARAGARSAYG